MDEKSIWKKEISFGRKPKAKAQEQPEVEASEAGVPEESAKPTSVWKKEISFGRKAKTKAQEQPEVEVSGADVPEESAKPMSMWKKEISLRRKPKHSGRNDIEPTDTAAEEDEQAEAASDEPVWKRAVSFTSKAEQAHAVAAEVDTVPSGDDPGSDPETGPEETVWTNHPGSDPEPGPEETVWTKEVSLSPAVDADEPVVEAEAAEPVAEQVPAEEPVAAEVDIVPSGDDPGSDPEPGPEETVWTREVSLSPAVDADEPVVEAEAAEPVAEQVPAEEPVAAEVDIVPSGDDPGSDPEPGPEETVWTREVSLSPAVDADEPVVEAAEPVAEQVPAEEPVAAEVDTVPSGDDPGSDPEPGPEETMWTKEVSLSPRAEAEEESVSPEADAVAPGDEPGSDPETRPEETVWKREVSFSRKPEDAPEPVAAEPVAPAEPVSVPAPPQTYDAPTVELPAPAPAPAAVVHPPVSAAELPRLVDEAAEKLPFWKKEISFGGKKRDKAPRAERAPKVKKEKQPKPPKQSKEPKEPKERKEKAPKVKRERGAGKGAKRLVGLKVGASQLAAARVANNGSAELLQVARGPLDPGIIVGGELRDPDALAAALKEFFAKHKLPKSGVRLGISNNRIGVRTFEIAGVEDEKQLANAILFRAQEALPIPIDEAVLDYQVLGAGVDETGQPTRRILLVVAYRELIDRYVDACKKAGISLVGIDLEAFALLRAVQAPQDGVGNDPSAALVAVAVGHERSTFAVSDGRVCEFTRVLEWGGSALNVALARVLDAAPSEVEDVKRSLSLVDQTVPHGLNADQGQRAVEAVRKSVQTFARELVSSLQYYQNQPGSLGIGEIVLTGGTAHLPGLAEELERLIGVRVRIGDPLARMKVSKKVGEPEQVGSLAVAIGLGIDD